jgi:probable LLM family oxidoreductase
MDAKEIEFGLNSFGQVSRGPDGALLSDSEAIRLVVEDAVLAESVGIDIFSIGEHYRPGFIDSAGHVILAAIAGRTERIRLGTSVLVLSSQDPVRVFAQYSTLDAVSGGRAQLIVGRASAVESFPLFGFELAEYEELFEQNLELLTKLLREQPVTWTGRSRTALQNQHVGPALATPSSVPTWVGVGGTPESVVRAARYGLPLMLAIIGGQPPRFAPYVELYERSLVQFGHQPLPVGEHSLGLIADTDEEAIEILWPDYRDTMAAASIERGFPSPTRQRYEQDIATGALFVGSPETVATRIAEAMRALRLSRFDIKYDMGALPQEHRTRTIELFGRAVIPRVREMLAEEPAPPADAARGIVQA